MKFTQTNNGYYFKKKEHSLKKLGQLVREGQYFTVQTEDGADITRATLVKIAFENFTIEKAGSNGFTLSDVLSLIISEDMLLDIIEDGGINNLMLRRLRGEKTVI